MTIAPISSGSTPAPDRSDLREAAQAFEAIFVRRLLAAARAGSLAEQGPFSGPGLEQFTAMRDEQVAEIAARSGGFGLADQIERQLSAMIRQQEARR
ncbi:MAG: rod-binding protein [Sphingomonadaceae bacterium]